MLVKAKWNVKGSDGWHMGGEVFHTEEDFGEAVEVLDAPKMTASEKEPDPVPESVKEEPVKEQPKPKTSASRRKKISE